MSETLPNVIRIVNCTLAIIRFWAVNSQVNSNLEKRLKPNLRKKDKKKTNSATALSYQLTLG